MFNFPYQSVPSRYTGWRSIVLYCVGDHKMATISTNLSKAPQTSKTKTTGFSTKKPLIFFSLFLMALGFASVTTEIMGCFTLPVDGFLYLFGTTSHIVFKPLLEASTYLIITGSVLLVLTLLFHPAMEKTTSGKSIRFHKFGPWKTRRATIQSIVFLAILSHVALVNAGVISIPAVCPLSFAEQASMGTYGFSTIFFALVFLSVLMFGRSICSWACVYGPVQEHCAGALKTVGVNPNKKPFKQLGLVQLITAVFWVSLALALYRNIEVANFKPMQGYKLDESWVFVVGIISFIPLTILMTYMFGNRYFCKYLCPIGGTMGLYSKLSLLKVRVNNQTCDACGICQEACPMGVTIDKKSVATNLPYISDSKCIQCGECVDACPTKSLALSFSKPRQWQSTQVVAAKEAQAEAA